MRTRRHSPMVRRTPFHSFSPSASAAHAAAIAAAALPNHPDKPADVARRRFVRVCALLLCTLFLLFERSSIFVTSSAKSARRAGAAIGVVVGAASADGAAVPSVAREKELNAARAVTSAAGDSAGEAPREANIAYFMQISEGTIEHLPRLLRVLYHERNVYAIHFDLKIPAHLVDAAQGRIAANPQYTSNVHIMPSELITYRGVSMLLNTINAMRLLLDKDVNWDYFINLSGADYPLITVETQRLLLGKKLGLNFFTFAPKRTWDNMAENRLAEVWFDESLTFRKNASVGALSKLKVRNPLVDGRQFTVSHAEAWMISARSFCDFVVRGDMARKMLVAFAYAVDSSEHYFASLAWNHEEYKKSIVPHSMRQIIWLHKGVLSGQHPYFIDEVDEDGGYKFKTDIEDSVLFFSRKFKYTDSKLMGYIDERAKRADVVSKARTHIDNKVNSRVMRTAEL